MSDLKISSLIDLSTQRFLSSNEENELVQNLKLLEESETYKILETTISQRSSIGINVYKKVLHKKEYVRNIFKHQVNTRKIKYIKPWLTFLVSKLGARSTIFFIQELDNNDNKLLSKALYWLPFLILDREKKAKDLLQKLIKEENKRQSGRLLS